MQSHDFKNVHMQRYIYNKSRTNPEKVKQALLKMVREGLGPDYDVEKHFTPSYNPWDQRLCLIPNADLFKSIRSGKTEIVTEQIDCITADGVQLTNGDLLPADILVHRHRSSTSSCWVARSFMWMACRSTSRTQSPTKA